jgi:RNA polymerase sigma-70 factor (ECF subfamily)
MSESPITRSSLLIRLRDPQDERAWAEFLEIYTPLVYRLARQKGFQDADAADLTQEVFRAVASAIDRWDPDPAKGSFRGWLFRIARNLMINFLAAQRRHPRGSGDTDFNRLLEDRPVPVEDSVIFDAEYKRRLFAWAAEQVRDEFRETTWQAFWRTSVEGHEVKKVAQDLDLTAGAVYIARSRVMARLRQKIEAVSGQPEDSGRWPVAGKP